LDRLEIDRIDGVIGRVIARVVLLQLLADTGFVEAGIENVRREFRLMVAVANNQERLPGNFFFSPAMKAR
jgi:hypothetical protein